MEDILYINSATDVRLKEMVSDTKSSEEDDDVPYYPDPSEPHD